MGEERGFEPFSFVWFEQTTSATTGTLLVWRRNSCETQTPLSTNSDPIFLFLFIRMFSIWDFLDCEVEKRHQNGKKTILTVRCNFVIQLSWYQPHELKRGTLSV